MPEWHQLDCMSGHVKESETSKILQLYATSRSISVSTRLLFLHMGTLKIKYLETLFIDGIGSPDEMYYVFITI